MKLVYPLIIVVVALTAACSDMPRVAITSHTGGAPVSVWVYDGNISVGEEPIHRKASDLSPILFQLDRDGEAGDYRFGDPPADVTSVPPSTATGQFRCYFVNDNLARCDRTGSAADRFKYTLYLVNRNNGNKIKADPFIITH